MSRVTVKKSASFVPSASGVALAELLGRGGPRAEAILAKLHRTMLWRYTTGRGLPDGDTIAFLHDVSGGRVAANGWHRIRVAS